MKRGLGPSSSGGLRAREERERELHEWEGFWRLAMRAAPSFLVWG